MIAPAPDAATVQTHRRGAVVLAAAAALLGLHAILAWQLRSPSITTGQDDAVYLLLARGLRRLSYHNFWLVDAPPQAQYPPLYPALLALVQSIVGERLGAGLALNVIFSTAALGTFFALARRWSAPVALLGLAAAAVNPWLIRVAGQICSEPLFMLAVALTLWWLAAPTPSPRSYACAGAMAIVASLTRSVGVALVAAVFLHWLLERRFRTALVFAVASGMTVGAWLLWMVAAPRGLAGQSYLADALLGVRIEAPSGPDDTLPGAAMYPADSSLPILEPPAQPAPAPRGVLATLAHRVWSNAPQYLTLALPSAMSLPSLKGTTLDNWLWLLATLVLGGLGLVQLTRRLPASGLLFLCYSVVLLLWPYSLDRFVVPLVPLVLLVLLLGAKRIGHRWGGVLEWGLPVLLTALLAGSGLGWNRRQLAVMAQCDRSRPFESPGCFRPEQRAFFAAAFRGAGEATPGAVFLAPKTATLFYLTGHRSVDVFYAASLGPPALRRYLDAKNVEYVLLSRVHLDQSWLARSLLRLCGEWELRGDDPDGAVLLRRRSGAGAESRVACEAIARFVRGPW